MNSSRLRRLVSKRRRASPNFSCCFSRFLPVVLVTAWSVPSFAYGSTEYYRQVVFDNSLSSDYYFYSWGQASKPSSLEQKNGRLPVESRTFLTPPNAIRIEWQSQPGGGWEAEVRVMNSRYRFPEMSGHNLYLWCFSPEPIAAAELPLIVLSNTYGGLQVAQFPGSFTQPVPLGKFAGNVPGEKWMRVRIPLSEFRSATAIERELEARAARRVRPSRSRRIR